VRKSGKIEKNPEKLQILKLNRVYQKLFFGTRNTKKWLKPRISVLSICGALTPKGENGCKLFLENFMEKLFTFTSPSPR
jgi:hypothetical protein